AGKAPLVIAAIVALLLLCVGVAGAAALVLRARGGDPTPTAAAVAGNATPVSAAAISTTPGASPAAGGGGNNVAPPPPGSTPTLTIPPTPTPVPPPTATAPPATATAVPTRPRATATAGAARGRVYTNATWGIRLTLPAGWTVDEEESDHVSFLAPDGHGLFYVGFGAAGSGLTPTDVLQQDLQQTARSDPNFQPQGVQIKTGNFQGHPAAQTDTYQYRSGSTTVEESDIGVIATTASGRAKYLLAAIAPASDFEGHVDDFNAIINSVVITGP
ncbi:MAG TPA: hypothetical protein VFW96_01635, partial [Thermomicrobiales bacterium]|nr:hypothetical protein [Thermomicrobiales bacterium]